jgi:hypothetical protein
VAGGHSFWEKGKREEGKGKREEGKGKREKGRGERFFVKTFPFSL